MVVADKPFGPGFERVENLVDLSDAERDRVDHPRTVVGEGEGNLYSSQLAGPENASFHAPTLDIDFPCYLIESSTPGHFHLYIDKAMMWADYAHLLMALRDSGIIQPGYCDLSLARGASHLRKPDVQKMPNDLPDS